MRLNEILAEAPRRPRRTGLVLAAALACAAPLALAQGMLIKGAAAAPGSEIVYSHAVLDEATLTSAYGVRKHPITKEAGWHNGTDLAAPEGTPVYAPTGGTVTRSEMTEGYGNLVVLKGAGDRQYRFGQLQVLKVKEGDIVKAGDLVGLVGQSGTATGPHLHFEVWHGEKPDDPQAEEGLVLANSLTIMASSGAKAPLPAVPPTPVVPVDMASAPDVILAPVPMPDTREELHEVISGAVAAQEACKKSDAWLAAPDTSAAWASRKAASKEANKAAGLSLDANWIPETVTLPAPYYPPGATSSLKSGACVVMFDLGTDGLPKNAAAECTDPVFADSAAQMNQASFKPALGPDGKPVEVKGIIYPMSYCVEG